MLFDHLVGAGEHGCWQFEAERLRGFLFWWEQHPYFFAAVHESAIGTSRPFAVSQQFGRFSEQSGHALPTRADGPRRYWPWADI